MPQIKPFLDAYIDANILLIVAFVVWALLRQGPLRLWLRHAHSLQLRLVEGFMLALILSPFLALGVREVWALFFPAYSLSAADIAVSHYLSGRVAMDAHQFETLLNARGNLVLDMAYLRGPVAQGLMILLAAGMAFGFLRLGVQTARLNRFLKGTFAWRRFGNVELRLSDQVSIPFSTRGLRRHYVVLPSGMLMHKDELRMALAHELQHLRRYDIEWQMLMGLLQPVFFWNPAFHGWKRDLEELRELGCDQVLIERKRVARGDYAHCLISVCGRSLQHPALVNIAMPKVSLLPSFQGPGQGAAFQALRARIDAIVEPAPNLRHPGLMFWTPMLMALCIFTLAALAIQKPKDWSHDRLMLSTIVNLERMAERNALLGVPQY